MALFGIMSDTHGNRELMLRAGRLMAGMGAECICHLGDTYRDSRELLGLGIPVIAVPGNWDPEFTDPGIPNARADTVAGIKVGMVHDPLKLPGKIKAGASLILTGHSHDAQVYRDGRKIFLNPGHLKSASDKGFPPGFATAAVEGNTVVCRLHDAAGSILEEKKYVFCG